MVKKQSRKTQSAKVVKKEIRKKAFTSGNGFSLRDILGKGSYGVFTQTYYELYEQNGDLRACIREIAKKVGLRGLYLTDKRTKKVKFSEENLQDVINLFLGNGDTSDLFNCTTFYDFKLEFFKHLKVGGELYFTSEVNGLGEMQRIIMLDPRGMQKYVTADGKISKYLYYTAGAKAREYKPEEIVYIRFEKSTRDSSSGLSLLEGIVWDALTDLHASKSNYYFFENNAVPRAVFKLADASNFEDDEYITAAGHLRDSVKGTENQHKSILSNIIESVELLEVSNKDIEYISQRKLTTDKVCSITGVPKNILGYVENVNYANAKELYKKYIEGTIRPAEEFFEAVINLVLNHFVLDFRDKYLEVDGDDGIDKFDLHKDQREDITSGVLTVDEVRIERGLAKKPKEETTPA